MTGAKQKWLEGKLEEHKQEALSLTLKLLLEVDRMLDAKRMLDGQSNATTKVRVEAICQTMRDLIVGLRVK